MLQASSSLLLPRLLLLLLARPGGANANSTGRFSLPQRQHCADGAPLTEFPAYPHGHFVSWGHCERLSLASLSIEAGNMTLIEPITNATCDVAAYGGELIVTSSVVAPDAYTFGGAGLNALSGNLTHVESGLFNATAACHAHVNATLGAMVHELEQHKVLLLIQQVELDQRTEGEASLSAELNATLTELDALRRDAATLVEHLQLQKPPASPPAAG